MIYNTGETDETLKAEYNPEGSILRKCQLRMLEMLCYFDDICKKIGIEYGLDGGNVLGAVRHGGFIPWDDDIDVHIRKEDETKLIKYLLKNPHPQFVLQCNKTDPKCYNPWPVLRDLKSEYFQDSASHNAKKYRGLQIDIFTMQKGTIKPLFWFNKKISALNNNYLAGNIPIVPKLIYLFQQYITNPFFSFISKLFGNKNYCSYSYGCYNGVQYPVKVIFPSSQMNFENKLFPVPRNVHEYLTIMFGNYQDLPPKDKRNWHMASYHIED